MRTHSVSLFSLALAILLSVGCGRGQRACPDCPPPKDSCGEPGIYPGPECGARECRRDGTWGPWMANKIATPCGCESAGTKLCKDGNWSPCTVGPSVPSGTNGVVYDYMPPAQSIYDGSRNIVVPKVYIHQTAWADRRTSANVDDIAGVYVYDYSGWTSMVWRWADTMRNRSIQRVTLPSGKPAYRVELTPGDHASPGTDGDHPRAEFLSVDATEDRREHVPPRENIFRDGDEYWATFALYVQDDFPTNHLWATLVQRKFQNGQPNDPNWFTLNVHRTIVDLALPGTASSAKPYAIATLGDLKQWVQFTFHEKVSSGPDGKFEIFMNGCPKASRVGSTILAGDINFNIHFGYYRANEKDPNESDPPGTGVVFYSPLLIFKGAQPSKVPPLP